MSRPITAVTTKRPRLPAETGIPVYKFDVADFAACPSGVKEIEAAARRPVEVLVNNAGITRDTTMHRMSFEQWNAVIQTNLSSCFNMCQGGDRWDARPQVRPHRQYRLDQRPGRAVRPGQLRRREIGHPWLHQGAGAGRRGARHHRQCGRARLCRYRDGARGAARRAGEDRRRASRSAGSARPTTSRARCCSWSPTRPISSPARRCRSMAASTCTEPGVFGRHRSIELPASCRLRRSPACPDGGRRPAV